MFKKWRQHLDDSGWTYWEHFKHGMHQTYRLYVVATQGLIHSFIPGVWPGKAPLGIYHLYKDMRKLKHVQPLYKKDDLLDAEREKQ